jgi:hypothetical protein
MVSVLDILKYFGYSNPVKAYQTLNMDTITDLIHRYYELNTIK